MRALITTLPRVDSVAAIRRACSQSFTDSPEPCIERIENRMRDIHMARFPEDPMRQHITKPHGLQYVLRMPKGYIRQIWRDSVMSLTEKIGKDQPLFLAGNAAYYLTQNRDYFTPIDLDILKKLELRRVVTLIDDIYDIWYRLRKGNQLWDQATYQANQHTPFSWSVLAITQLLTLLDWRSAEILAAEAVASALHIPHLVLAVKHPCEVLYGIICEEKVPVYVSHPITEPRRLEQSEDVHLVDEFKDDIAKISDELIHSPTYVPILPTAIDELRISRTDDAYVPLLRQRWPTPNRTLLQDPSPDNVNPLDPRSDYNNWNNGSKNAISELLAVLADGIGKQISSRDRKLVEQCPVLVVWHPYFNGRISGGVSQEVEHLGRMRKFPDSIQLRNLCLPESCIQQRYFVQSSATEALYQRLSSIISINGRVSEAWTHEEQLMLMEELKHLGSGMNSHDDINTFDFLQFSASSSLQLDIPISSPGGAMGADPGMTRRVMQTEAVSTALTATQDPIVSNLTDSDVLRIGSATAVEFARAVLGMLEPSTQSIERVAEEHGCD